MTTYAGARDAVYDHFQKEWDSKAPGIVGQTSAPEVFIENLEKDHEPPGDFYVKLSMTDVFGQDAVLGATLFDVDATLTVQIHTPGGAGMDRNDRLAQMVVERFRGQTVSGVRCRRVRRVTVGAFGSTYQTNVLVDLEYEDRK